ncbi:cell wall metabolism sensor histidine kinase WalK, partial [Paenibacillus sepulcri]|nr:cell wall metabolism sensor histidine kinase WalK [Paenibacillus sepulcri]
MKLGLFSRFRSIQTNMVLAFVLLILMTILIMSVVSYYLSKDAVQSNAQTYTTELVKQVNNNIKSYVNGMKYISDMVDGNPYVQQYLSQFKYESLTEEQKSKQAVADFLESMAVSRADISSVSLFGYNGQFVTGSK